MSSFRTSVAFSNTDIGFSSDSPKWRYMKKQVMIALKERGDGLKNLETQTLHYGNEMLKTIEQYKGGPFDPRIVLHTAVAHMLLVLVFGQSSDEDAAACIEDERNLEQVFTPSGAYLILDIIPFLRYIVTPLKKAYITFIDAVSNSHAIYDKCTTARRKLYDHPNVEVCIDHFFKLHIMNQAEGKMENIDETDIRSMAFDMVAPGLGTAKTLRMILAILVNHPDIQEAIFKEIDDVIGKRQPTIEDKLSMPFTQAVILETLRYHSFSALHIPHVTRHNSELQGFIIPAGTMVFTNVWALHHDDRYWESPWEFIPSRWIEDGKILPPDDIKYQRLLPFSAGIRQCPGEAFAKNRLFILTTLMLQNFKFVPAEGHPRPTTDPTKFPFAFGLNQTPYKLSVKLRD